jgi:hypothetical protein
VRETTKRARSLLRLLVLDRDDSLALLRNTGSATRTSGLVESLSTRRDRAKRDKRQGTLFFVRRASIWSVRTLVRFLSAFALWMYSIRTRLFLKTLPFDFW